LLLDNIVAQHYNISLKSNNTSPFSSLEALAGESLHRRKKRQKSLFLFTAESGQDFQRGQIWNDRSQKPKTKQQAPSGEAPIDLYINQKNLSHTLNIMPDFNPDNT
jgi:hypothetical protein